MKVWAVSTIEKKNVFQRTHFIVNNEIADGKVFYLDEWYRWGKCVVLSEDKPTHSKDDYQNPFELNDYEVEDQECDDGCSLDIVFEEDDDWTEEQKQWVLDLWDEGGWSSLEENEIYADDCDTQYYGPLEVELIEERPDEPVSESKGGWPFG